MVAAAKSVGSTLALLIIFLYVFALVFTMLMGDIVDDPQCENCDMYVLIDSYHFYDIYNIKTDI